MEYASGELIQLSCDYFIGTRGDFEYNPKIRNCTERFVFLDNNKSEITASKVFCYTHCLDSVYIVNTLRKFASNFELYCHNSDTNFEKKYLYLFDKVPKLKRIHTQNMNVLDSRVSPLPIGFANSMWPCGNRDIIDKYLPMTSFKKTKEVFFNFTIETNKAVRKRCFKLLNRMGIPFLERMEPERYFETLVSYKYAICPQGGGLDTHKFWECLYYKVIPIVKRCILTEYYSKQFNIILVDDWEEINEYVHVQTVGS